ncbi:MAG: PKD domain-containing protein, partial [Desulfobulbaceae bacterium]|nr:PKD domain-containing protein [Desulfobulbaceae bacterium]
MNQCYGCTNGEKSPKSGSCDDGNTCTGQGACNAFGGCDAVPDDTIDPGVACKKCSGGNIVGDLNKNGRSCGEGRVCQAGYCVLGESDDELPPSNTATGTVIEPPSGSGDSCSSVLFSSASVTSNSQTSDLDLKEDITESVPVYIPFNETISGAQAVFSLIAQSVDVSCDMEFEWNFGDGGTSTEQHPVYFYENAGEYEVVIKARCSECSGWWAEVRAKVVVVKALVSSASIPGNAIGISLEPLGLGLEGTLEVNLIGTAGTDNYQVKSLTKSSGIHAETFGDINNLPDGEYTKVNVKWSVSGAESTGEFDYHFRILGVYRHSQYNTPSESDCTGNDIQSYITSNNSSNVTQCFAQNQYDDTTLRSQFVSQVNLNGSGNAINYGDV